MNKNQYSKILIVDDEPANIFLLEGLLTAEGYSVITASNGREAMNKLQNNLIDVVLLDIMMPEITGMEILKYIIADQTLKNIPVIMVSAKSEAEDVEKALDLGAVEYIKKPINEIELLARVRTILRLKKQDDEMKSLLKSKEEFINMVSHDVRTPFASITGYAELLLADKNLNKELSSEQKKFLQFIIDTSNYLYDYFNKLLNWANMGSQEIQLRRDNVSLSRILNASAVIFKSKLDDKKQNLTISCNDNTIVNVDAVYFSQVVNNLLSNSIKYTPEEGTINISSEINNDQLSILVKDSGIGMPEISHDELFGQSFHKSVKGTKGEKGTGIGLRICKKILDAHGFKMDYVSTPGAGTTFKINFY